MGYNTRYDLTIVKGDNSLIGELREFCEDAAYALDENGAPEESCKWYRCKDDMKRFSLLHPEALFKLHGDGEEAGDIWEAYFQNGKMQMCKAKITFDEFSQELLI